VFVDCDDSQQHLLCWHSQERQRPKEVECEKGVSDIWTTSGWVRIGNK